MVKRLTVVRRVEHCLMVSPHWYSTRSFCRNIFRCRFFRRKSFCRIKFSLYEIFTIWNFSRAEIPPYEIFAVQVFRREEFSPCEIYAVRLPGIYIFTSNTRYLYSFSQLTVFSILNKAVRFIWVFTYLRRSHQIFTSLRFHIATKIDSKLMANSFKLSKEDLATSWQLQTRIVLCTPRHSFQIRVCLNQYIYIWVRCMCVLFKMHVL